MIVNTGSAILSVKVVKHLVCGLKANKTLPKLLLTNCRQLSTQSQTSPEIITQQGITQSKPIAMSSPHIYTNDSLVVQLDAEKLFNGLTDEESLYAHYMSKASWFGSLINLFQTSPESPLIFTLFRRIFGNQSIDELKSLAQSVAHFDDNEWRALLVYLSAFLASMGNYRFYGSNQFIPDLPQNKLEALVVNSRAYQTNEKDLRFIWENVKKRMYSLEKHELSLGFPPEGTTTYFSKNCTKEDFEVIKEFMKSIKMDSHNSRVFKDSETNTFTIRFASILSDEDIEDSDYLRLNGNELNGYQFVLSRGDYSPLLEMTNKYLSKAKEFTENDTQKQMIEQFIEHFRSGDIRHHKDGSRHWIKDKGPIVETHIGFTYNYRDPSKMRAELMVIFVFEAFVTIVDKELSKKLESLVSLSPSLLPLLPWPKDLEKDRFLQPDFTSLDVLMYSKVDFIGYNIPVYADIRQDEGFKNMTFGNVITGKLNNIKLNFFNPDHSKLMQTYLIHSREVNTSLHELLGHGCGKLLQIVDGKPNFDVENTINPLTNEKVDKWYKTGETYESKFTSLSGPYEECRPECVGLYMCFNTDVLEIFGIKGIETQTVIYMIWLNMVVRGVEALQMYNTNSNKWGQAHAQAWYVILRVLLVTIEYIDKSSTDGLYFELSFVHKIIDVLVVFRKTGSIDTTLDRQLIESVSRKAIEDFLLRLQTYKSLGDMESAHQMFDAYSQVSDTLEHPFLTYRAVVMDRHKPRVLFVQSSTEVIDGKVVLKTFPTTDEGLIESFASHLDDKDVDIDDIVLELWRKDYKHFY
ncbi:unnamed protein product [Oppiella nova]|uniref:Dipeptidyl peptidase 3 n=1 Tax=Oppiella nova TaxID=334625 RepID=A0A7R9QIX3_9ACAR|nr:unnamed protein product [Oppiella nova]CAG2166263.1 unnamed protein product [Oppiella nova]